MPASDNWCTPRWMTERLPLVDLDPCANEQSTVRALLSVWLGPGNWVQVREYGDLCVGDGLFVPWHERRVGSQLATTAFVNPPYSRGAVLPFVRRAAEFSRNGGETLMLVKLDPTTGWWREASDAGAMYIMFRKRIRFEGAPSGARFNSAFILFQPEGLEPARSHFSEFLQGLLADEWIW